MDLYIYIYILPFRLPQFLVSAFRISIHLPLSQKCDIFPSVSGRTVSGSVWFIVEGAGAEGRLLCTTLAKRRRELGDVVVERFSGWVFGLKPVAPFIRKNFLYIHFLKCNTIVTSLR